MRPWTFASPPGDSGIAGVLTSVGGMPLQVRVGTTDVTGPVVPSRLVFVPVIRSPRTARLNCPAALTNVDPLRNVHGTAPAGTCRIARLISTGLPISPERRRTPLRACTPLAALVEAASAVTAVPSRSVITVTPTTIALPYSLTCFNRSLLTPIDDWYG